MVRGDYHDIVDHVLFRHVLWTETPFDVRSIYTRVELREVTRAVKKMMRFRPAPGCEKQHFGKGVGNFVYEGLFTNTVDLLSGTCISTPLLHFKQLGISVKEFCVGLRISLAHQIPV